MRAFRIFDLIGGQRDPFGVFFVYLILLGVPLVLRVYSDICFLYLNTIIH